MRGGIRLTTHKNNNNVSRYDIIIVVFVNTETECYIGEVVFICCSEENINEKG